MQTVGPGNSVMWDYDVDEEANIDRFNVYLNGEKTLDVPPTARSVPIQDFGIDPGDHEVGIAPENNLGEASRASVRFRHVTGLPLAVTNVRIGKV